MARARLSNREKKASRWPPLLLHLVLLAGFVAVLSWHLTPAANKQEVAKKWGWFFNYLTFISFAWQALAFSVVLLADVTNSRALRAVTDDLMCSTYGLAIFVTICYYVMLVMGAIVDSDEVPKWLSPVLHTGNTLALLLDFALCRRQRTFGRRGELLSQAVVVAYIGLCYASKQQNADFPYKFMNDLPEPQGLLATAVVLPMATQAIFLLGRKLRTGSLSPVSGSRGHRD